MNSNQTMIMHSMSVKLLGLQVLSQSIVTTFAIIGLIMSGAQLILIFTWKPLRSTQQLLIGAVALADLMKAVVIAPLSLKHIYAYYSDKGELINQLDCSAMLFPIYFVTNYGGITVMALSLERCISLLFPMWYRLRHRSVKIWLAVISPIVAFIPSVCVFVDADAKVILVICTLLNGPTAAYRGFMTYLTEVIAGLIFLINVITGSVVFVRWRAAVRAKADMAVFRSDMQLHVLKTLFAVVVLFLMSIGGTGLFTAVMYWAVYYDEYRTAYSPISGCFTLSRGMFDFLIYLKFNREYKNGFRVIFLKSNITVDTVTSISTRT